MLQRSEVNLEFRRICLQSLFVLKNIEQAKVEKYLEALLTKLDDED